MQKKARKPMRKEDSHYEKKADPTLLSRSANNFRKTKSDTSTRSNTTSQKRKQLPYDQALQNYYIIHENYMRSTAPSG